MRTLSHICLVAAALLLAWGEAAGEEAGDLAVIGARARAMGGAYTAVATGVDALVWNPAGLTEIERGILQADTRLSFGSGNIDQGIATFDLGAQGESPVEDFRVSPGTRFTYYMVGGAAPLPLGETGKKYRLTGAAGYRRVIDRFFRQEQLVQVGSAEGFNIPLEHIDDSRGGVDAYALSLAGQPHTRLSLGLSVNFLTNYEDAIDQQLVAFQGQEFFNQEVRNRYSFGGTSYELGARVKVLPKLTVAGVLRPGYDLKFTRGLGSFRLLAPPGGPVPAADTLITASLDDATQSVPTFWSLGAAVTPLPGLLVAADFEYRPWNESEVTVHTAGGPVEFDSGFYQTHSFRIGTEYTMNPDGRVVVPLRFGVRTTPTTLANVDSLSADVSPDGFRTFRGDRVEGTTISGGIGIHFETVDFDVSVDRASFTVSEHFFNAESPPGVAPVIIQLTEALWNLYFTSTLRF